MAFINNIQEWTGDNFTSGMVNIHLYQLKDVLDEIAKTVNNGN